MNFWILLLIFAFRISKSSQLLISQKSTDQTDFAGNQLLLRCTFAGEKKGNITWFKDDKKLENKNNGHVVITTASKKAIHTSTLYIYKLLPSDQAKYRCSGTSTSNLRVSHEMYVTVKTEPPLITSIWEDLYLRQDQRYEIDCQASGRPEPKLTWSRSEQMLDPQYFESLGNGSLIFKKAQKSNEGVYTCTAKNDAGTTAKSFQMGFVERTEWISKPNDVVKKSNSSHTWTAVFLSTEKDPQVEWYKDDLPVGSQLVKFIGAKFTTSLTFEKLDITDFGKYHLKITSAMISDVLSADMHMTVEAPPRVAITDGEQLAIKPGKNVSIKCEVESFPAADVKWVFNGSELVRSGKSSADKKTTTVYLHYRLTQFKVENEGIYTCIGTNKFGTFESKIKLMMKDIDPGSPENKTVIIIITSIGVVIIVLIIIIVAVLIWRHKMSGDQNQMGGGKFYTDLGEEESDYSTLEDIEFAQAPGRTISISGRRPPKLPSKMGLIERKNTANTRVSRKQAGARSPLISPTEMHYARPTIGESGKPFEFDQINLEELIGSGEYGEVAKGQVKLDDEQEINVSIKLLHEECSSKERCDMIAELQMMRKISSHQNVVSLIGWCVLDANVYIIEELMPYGTLLELLRAHRSIQSSYEILNMPDELTCLESKDLVGFAWQVCNGMKYLESVEVVHRDLACRNVLVGHKHTCKLTDYGISRDVYTENVFRRTTGGQLPVRWMAYESIFDGEFTSMSDVWSFGILIWEILTLGQIPYQGIIKTEDLLKELESGYMMSRPEHVGKEIYGVMKSCWNREPVERPTFEFLTQKIEEMQRKDEVHIDLDKLRQLEMDDIVASENACMQSPSTQLPSGKSPFVPNSRDSTINIDANDEVPCPNTEVDVACTTSDIKGDPGSNTA